jgi:hypothetical protein
VSYDIQYDGIFPIQNDDLFPIQMNVIWKFINGHFLILVCNTDENLINASNLLVILENFTKDEVFLFVNLFNLC